MSLGRFKLANAFCHFASSLKIANGTFLPVPRLNLLQPVEVGFSFIQSEQTMRLNADVISIADNEVRLKISNIDIDSISQLKRFIELNVGNNELLNRELEHLSDLGEE